MPDSVIRRVEQMAEREARSGGRRFRDKNNKIFAFDDGDDDDWNAPISAPNAHSDVPAEFPGVSLERDQPVPAVEEPSDKEVLEDDIRGRFRTRRSIHIHQKLKKESLRIEILPKP